jgi:predicted exporter
MELRRQKLFARLLLATGVLLGLGWLAQLDYARKISTNVLDLIPRDERSPELAIVRSLAGEQQARVALLALQIPRRPDETEPAHARRLQTAAATFIATLRQSPAFAEAMLLDDTAARDALGRQVFAQRFDLLLPNWLAERVAAHAATAPDAPWPEWLAERTASELEASLARPEALAFQELMPADPLLLLPKLVERVQGLADSGAANRADRALIWARTSAAPLSEEGQAPVFAAVAQALAAAQKMAPDAKLQWTAISRFAAESRRRIEAEMSGLNLLSLVAVLAVAAICVRRVLKTLHLSVVILCALLGAWVVTTLVFDRVHVLVFVVGSLLGGVAVDYGFYLYLQPARWPGETYREKVGRLLKPLLASALTTVLGFSILLFSELPLIRQLGVFVSAGLLCALAGALLWFAQIDEPFLETRSFIRARLAGGRPARRRGALGLLLGAALIGLLGPWRLQWRDDIRELEIAAPELRANDQALRALFGDSSDRTLYLTRGDTPAAARVALEKFLAWHTQTYPDRSTATLGLALPTVADWDAAPARLAALGDFEPALRAALGRHGFDPESFAPFFAAWREWRARPQRPAYDAAVREFAAALRGPPALLLSVAPGACWIATITEHPPGAEPPAATATVSANQLETLNGLFARYRASALRLSMLGLGLLGLSVLALYGPRRGLRIFALPCGSCLFAFGALGLAGQTLNLFHLLGAFLGVCLSHNYAIFSAENAARGDIPPPSIRLSALTTAASFGVLALSKIPVVAALGSTVALIVMTALVAVELEPLTHATAHPEEADRGA